MNKGIIMNIGRNSATVLTRDMQMVKVKYQHGMVRGQEFDLDSTARSVNQTRFSRRLVPVLAACLVILITAGILFSGVLASPVYATLSVDVNPSIEFALNRDLNVIKTRAINEEAKQLMANHDFTGLNWQEALRQWTSILKAQNQIQVQNMLISAVMPEDALQLRNEMIALEGLANQGELSGIQVRIIYSSDKDIAGQAVANGLSVGRQMLLNQAKSHGENLDANAVAQGKLDELMGKFLRQGERDQTRLTQRTTESAGEPSGSGETQQETNRETQGSEGSQPSYQETNRETNRETQGSQSGTQETNRETIRESTGEPSSEPSSSQASSQSAATSGPSAGPGEPSEPAGTQG